LGLPRRFSARKWRGSTDVPAVGRK
jgi:hypothetical protein